ncbi:MAG: XdhC family protein [Desulfurivibrionaceae bacterium]
MEETKIYEEILRARTENVPVVLAIVTESHGSSPQRSGAKMLIRADGSTIGTVGGGPVEKDVINLGRESINQRTGPRTMEFELDEKNGFLCGGRMRIYVEPLYPQPRLIIIGAGHVGQALANLADFSGYHTTVIDDREEYANRENIPVGEILVVSDFQEALAGLTVDKESSLLIATRGHEHDFSAALGALASPAAYIGIVGSRKKKAGFFKSLEGRGFSDADLQRIHMPVGLSIGSVTPAEIAVSIMAQIIQQRRCNASSADRSSGSCRRPFPAHGCEQTAAAPSG